jgi:hypothetical protein
MFRAIKTFALFSLVLSTGYFFSDGSALRSPGGACWLLSSPQSQYLSGSGESALVAACTQAFGELATTKKIKSEISYLAHYPLLASQPESMTNLLVNNPNEDAPENTTQSEATIVVYGETVMVGFIDTGNFLPRTPGVSSLSGLARSTDKGLSFVEINKVPPNEKALGISDPSLAVDSKGNFYIATIQQVPTSRGQDSYMGVARSIDGGATFSRSVLIAGTGPVDQAFQDKELIAADNTGGRFEGYVYMAWTEFDTSGSHVLFTRSTDGAQTFSTPIVLSDGRNGVQGATPAVGPNGEVYVLWLSFGRSAELKIRKSLDGGVTFEPEKIVAPFTVSSDSAASRNCNRRALKGDIRYLEIPSMAVDQSHSPTRGTVYVTYSSDPDGTSGPDVADVYLVRSTDGGDTWSAPLRVNDDRTQTDQFQPAVAVAGNGTVGLMFYDRRLDLENLNIDVFIARSSDGGQTFEPNLRVTHRSFPVPPIGTNGRNFDSLRSICYMGDYNQIAADNEAFYLVWGDNRMTLFTDRFPVPNGRPDPNVFFAKIPLNPGTSSEYFSLPKRSIETP